MCVCVCVCVYIYIYTYTHTHKNIIYRSTVRSKKKMDREIDR